MIIFRSILLRAIATLVQRMPAASFRLICTLIAGLLGEGRAACQDESRLRQSSSRTHDRGEEILVIFATMGCRHSRGVRRTTPKSWTVRGTCRAARVAGLLPEVLASPKVHAGTHEVPLAGKLCKVHPGLCFKVSHFPCQGWRIGRRSRGHRSGGCVGTPPCPGPTRSHVQAQLRWCIS